MGPKLVDLFCWCVTLRPVLDPDFRITRSYILSNPEKCLQVEFTFQIELKALHPDALSSCIIDKANGQARSKSLKYRFNRVRASILAQQYRWLVSLDNEGLGPRGIFLTRPKEAFDCGA